MMTRLPANFELDRYGLHVRLVREEDAEFIVKLRTDENLSQYLNKIGSNIKKQIEWIREYKKREALGEEYYFIFEIIGECKVGLVRIYQIEENRFTSGSWIVKSDVIGVGIICDIIAREIAFEMYPLSLNYYDIRKGNKNVIRYAESYSPVRYAVDDENYYYYINKDSFDKYKVKYLRMLVKK
jgi:hypothetical protein